MTDRLTDQQLNEIEARTAADSLTPGPWMTTTDGTADEDGTVVYVNRTSPKGVTYSSVLWNADWATEADAEFTAHARTDVPALLAEIRTMRTALVTLADRWQELADHGDAAIGHFEGPAAATLDAEVGERGRTYRKAADDIRNALRTGRIPHDLMTAAELTP